MSRLEKDIQTSIKDYGQSLAIVVRKLNIDGENGWPDLLCLYSGVTWFIEVKRFGELARPAQKRIHRLIRKTDHDVFVVDNISDGKLIMDMQRHDIDLRHHQSNEDKYNGRHNQ